MARYEITNEQKPIEFEGLGEVKRIVQNCKNLLMTRLGEVPFDRLRGFNWALFDLPTEEFRTRLLPEVDRVLLWEPRAEAVDATFTLNKDMETVIKVIVEVEEG
nr:MAG TPA: lysozyme [Caudoviricetes sp.]